MGGSLGGLGMFGDKIWFSLNGFWMALVFFWG